MSMGIFVFLFLVSLVCLIIGLIKPSIFSKLLGSTVTRKKTGLVFGLATFILFILVGVTAPPVSKTSNKVEKPVSAVQPPVAKQTEPTKAEPVAVQPVTPPKPQELSTLDKLWAALDTSIGTRDAFDVGYDKNTGTAKLTYTLTTAWDENAIVRAAYAVLVKYGTEAFKVDGIVAVTVDLKTGLQDSYGKKSVDDAVIITMPKIEFEKYDWSTLMYQPISRQMKLSSTEYYILPSILIKLDPSKLYLSDTVK